MNNMFAIETLPPVSVSARGLVLVEGNIASYDEICIRSVLGFVFEQLR